MQGVQATQDPEASQLPASQGPQLEQTPSPIRTVFPQKVLSTEILGGGSPSKQTGQASVRSAPSAASSLESEDSEESSKKPEEQEEEVPPQEADTGVRDSEFVFPEGVVGSVQVADLQTTQKAEGSPAPAGGDTTMGNAPGITASDPDSRLSVFLARFDLLEFNNLPTSHFHSFGSSYGSFLRFSVLVEGLPLLEGLLKSHGDFTSGFREGVFLGNILMELLCAVLISLRDSSIDSLSE